MEATAADEGPDENAVEEAQTLSNLYAGFQQSLTVALDESLIEGDGDALADQEPHDDRDEVDSDDEDEEEEHGSKQTFSTEEFETDEEEANALWSGIHREANEDDDDDTDILADLDSIYQPHFSHSMSHSTGQRWCHDDGTEDDDT